MSATNKKTKEFSEEELKIFRQTQIDFMKNQIKDLEIQEQYTKLKAQISENVFNEHVYKIKLAQLKAPNPVPPSDEKEIKEE
jgi:hypothetical protein